ncbi:hypothetical protein [Dokdonella sp.]|uniref:hypothetical protein n=1 Tax=Dokdonella sp. TaxID=2291710 RepID=UPI001B204360|nr:hypothetical protein [Dokdonella sp.]MBO9663731.1 hypothetical protein [Dokdonella sp.]
MPCSTVLRPLFVLTIASSAAAAFAQDPPTNVDGWFDPSFSGDGRLQITHAPASVFTDPQLMIQPGGRILIGGACKVGSDTYPCAARLLPDGTPDFSFGPNATAAFVFDEFAGFPRGSTFAFAQQPDARFLVFGDNDYASEASMGARLTRDGQLERWPGGAAVRSIPLSAHPTSPNSRINCATVLANGKIIVAGVANRLSNADNEDFAIARLNADLTLDTTFNSAGARPGVQLVAFDQGGDNRDQVAAVAVQRDGKIVAVGVVGIPIGYNGGVVRLNADGSLDTGFGSNGRILFNPGQIAALGAVAIDRQQRIVVAGAVGDFNDSDMYVARLRGADGALDVSFGGTGAVRYGGADLDSARAVAIQSDGRVVAAGTYGYNDFGVVRWRENGVVDSTFGVGGRSTGSFAASGPTWTDGVTAMTLDGGRALVAGMNSITTDTSYIGVARLTADRIFIGGFE